MMRIALLCLSLLCATEKLSGQLKAVGVQYVSIKDVRLSLGMSYKQVEMSLSPMNLYVVAVGSLWYVLDAPAYKENAHTFGILTFDRNGLASVMKSWNLADQKYTSEEVLFYLVDTFVRENNTRCELSTEHTDSLEEETKRAWIACGAKKIRVTYLRMKQPTGAVISEVDEVLSR